MLQSRTITSFCCRVQYITTPGWGSQSTMAHKTSTGLLGQLKLRQVDLAVNTLYVYQDRIAIVDYSVVVAMHKLVEIVNFYQKYVLIDSSSTAAGSYFDIRGAPILESPSCNPSITVPGLGCSPV